MKVLLVEDDATMCASNKLFDYHAEQMALALQDSAFQQTNGYKAPARKNEEAAGALLGKLYA